MKILAIVFLLSSCGYEPSGKTYEPPQTPQPPQPPGGAANDWAAIKPLVDEQCALSGCHAGAAFLSTGASFKASNSLRRIESGNMPVKTSANYSLYNSAKRRKFIDYLSN